VELDHVVPGSLGGPSSVDNCRLLCRVHNDLAARLIYGNDWMDHYTGCTAVGEGAGR
jgi:5-methylcytosine-specific restriction endonuclease McrA